MSEEKEQVKLFVKIKGCRDLLVGDTTTSDPYVKVQLGLKDVHRTKHILKTLNPIFTEDHACSFRLTVSKHDLLDNRGLVFKVMDWDRFSFDDNIGASRVLPQPLIDAKGEDIEVKLFPPPEKKGQDAGFLTIWCQNETSAGEIVTDDESDTAPAHTSKNDAQDATIWCQNETSAGEMMTDDENDTAPEHSSKNGSQDAGAMTSEGGGELAPQVPTQVSSLGPLGVSETVGAATRSALEEEEEEDSKVKSVPKASNDAEKSQPWRILEYFHLESELVDANESAEEHADASPSPIHTGSSGQNTRQKRLEQGVVSSSGVKPDSCTSPRGDLWTSLVSNVAATLLQRAQASRRNTPVLGSSGSSRAVRGDIALTSDAFKDGDKIPVRFTSVGENISPPISWSGAPPLTKSFVLIFENILHRIDHWVVFNIPRGIRHLKEGVDCGSKIDVSNDGRPAYILQGISSTAESQRNDIFHGYRGPDPPSCRGLHTYVFSIYALDGLLKNVDAEIATSKAVASAILSEGRVVLGTGMLTGTFERP